MSSSSTNQQITNIHNLLRTLSNCTYAELPSPEKCKKRASVALVIRIKPSHAHFPTTSTKQSDLESFFAQEWVQHGDPEVLFIKRASRKGDRWTSHIALPGGKKDVTDKDDQAAAIRESSEEVGLDILSHGIECGNLPQRLVTTHWGKKPLLVLCPYVFLLTTHEVPRLNLQPSEVASTHWVPIRSLQDPRSRTVAFEDVSSRLANQETGVKKWMLSLILGKMVFAAISLLPTETLYASEPSKEKAVQLQDNHFSRQDTLRDHLRKITNRIYTADIFNQYPPPHPPEGPLLLWGLTLGVLSDFLDLLPPHDALTLWTYPNFTPLDVRFVVWLMTYNFKERKRAELQSGSEFLGKPAFGYASESLAHPHSSRSIVDASTVLVSHPQSSGLPNGNIDDTPDETGFHGLGTGVTPSSTHSENGGEPSEPSDNGSATKRPGGRMKKAAVSTMLEGFVESFAAKVLPEITNRARYYDIVRRAVAVALIGRASFAAMVVVLLLRRWKVGSSAGILGRRKWRDVV